MDEIKKLIWVMIGLSIFGVVLVGISLGYLEPAFNYVAYVSFVVDSLIFITIGILLFFTITIVAISIPISHIGKYYQLNPKSKSKTAIIENLKVVLKNNLILTIPLYFSIMYLLNPSNYFSTLRTCDTMGDINSAFVVTLAIIPAYLLSLRLLTNPIRGPLPIFNIISTLLKDHYSSAISAENLRERFMSFYFSLTASAFFIMIMLYLYKSIPLNLYPLDVPSYILKSLGNTFIPIFDSNSLINVIRIVLFFIAYLIALFVTTSFGEIILDRCKLHIES